MAKQEHQLSIIKTINRTKPWGFYKMCFDELKNRNTPYCKGYIQQVLSEITDYWNTDIVNVAIDICEKNLVKTKKITARNKQLYKKSKSLT